MKIIFDRELFLKDLRLVKQVISKAGNIKPLLSYAKVDADERVIMATDLAVGIRHKLRCKVLEAGTGLLPVDKILAVLKDCKDHEITITTDDASCEVITSTGAFKLAGEDASKFPDIQKFTESQYDIEPNMLREMIKRTSFAAATEHARYALTGILWEVDGAFRLIATDGRRLAVTDGVGNGKLNSNGKTWVVPTRTMELLSQCLPVGKSGGFIANSVSVHFRENDVLFKTANDVILSRLVDGRYPPYKEILPKNRPVGVAELTVGPFADAVKQAAIATDDMMRYVQFAFSDGMVKMTSDNNGSKMAVELKLPYKGDAVSVKLDPKFVTEVLHVFGKRDKLELNLYADTKPVLFTSENFRYLVQQHA